MPRPGPPIVSLTALGLVLVLTGCRSGDAGLDDGPSTEPLASGVVILAQVAGTDLPIETYGLGLVDPGAFGQLGLDEKFTELEVGVDFDMHSVILLSLGQQPTGGYSAEITGLQLKGDLLYVQATAVAPGPDDATTKAITYPYSAVAVPKLPGGLTLLSDITSLP
ncbi:MAG: protease complex subunit PrcB family protein [Planctomycetota bacterium]